MATAPLSAIKREDDTTVKTEDIGTPMDFVDDDNYEDTGELTVPRDPPKIWLTRVPQWLWESLATSNGDEEVEIGKIRVWDPDSKGDTKMKLILNEDFSKNKDVPSQYSFDVTNQRATNTFIFSEKDLPGYKPNSAARAKSEAGSTNNTLDASKSGMYRVQKPRYKFRRAIPKHTELIGKVIHEANCLPVENTEYQRFMNDRALKTIRGGEDNKILMVDIKELMAPSADFSKFIKTKTTVKARPQENKASRMPENELLDLLFDKFKKYKYWPMKSLKAETRQPEAYLRETLSKIATLIKSGQMASCWTLKPEMVINQYDFQHASHEQAPGSELPTGANDDEDDDLEFIDAT